MILPSYHISPSQITGSGKGLFLNEPISRGRLITAPDDIPRVYRFADILALPNADEMMASTVRWFEDRYTITPEWPDECYINHSFSPTGLWHLGFIFAADDLSAGTEITVNYRHLLAPNQEEAFHDARTGKSIIGYSWEESLRESTLALARLLT